MDELLKDATLRDIIRLKFRTYQEFADKLGWTRQRLDYTLDHPESIDLGVAAQMADALGVELDADIIRIFLRTT